MNTAAIASPKADDQGDFRWNSQHERICGDCNLIKPAVLFVGDSIIQKMEDTEAWNKYFQPLPSVNAGIGGDSIEHVIWRLENGLFRNCSPKVVVVLVGTNNHGHTPDEMVEGLETLAWSVNKISPISKIVILGILPRGEKNNKLRQKFYEVNYNLGRLISTVPNAYFLDADPGFVRKDDTIAPEDMLDYLHLTRRGYDRFCSVIYSYVRKLLDGKHL